MSIYNGDNFIYNAIQSLQNQSFKDFEIIIIDDGSRDKSNSILLEMIQDKLIDVLIVNVANIGLTKSLNLGVKNARGSLIARQDVDDISLSNRLKDQIEFIKKYDLIGGLTINVYTNNVQKDVVSNPNALKTIFLKSPFAHSTAMFVKDRFIKIGGYNESFPVSQDFELWMRFAESGNVGILNKPAIKRLVHDDMISRKLPFRQLYYSHKARMMHLHSSRFLPIYYMLQQVAIILLPRPIKELIKKIKKEKK
jgi:glycosyltransferase involved in cell wall biosynthesis